MRLGQMLGFGSRRTSVDKGTTGGISSASVSETRVSDQPSGSENSEDDYVASWRDPSTFANEAERLSLLQLILDIGRFSFRLRLFSQLFLKFCRFKTASCL